MARTLFSVAVLVLLAGLISAASAQEKNELTGLIGRTFVSDHAAIDTSTPGALLTSGAGWSVEANYGRRLMDLGIVGLTAEVPLVVNFDENVHYPVNLVPRDYKSFIVTPSLRANLFPGQRNLAVGKCGRRLWLFQGEFHAGVRRDQSRRYR